MAGTPDIGFSFGVEGDQTLIATINRLRQEMKTLQSQQESVESSAISLAEAWRGLAEAAAVLELGKFAKEAFDSVVAMGRLSAATGISTQTLSVFRKATEDLGLEQEKADTAILRLSRSILKLGEGNKQVASTFAQLRDSAGRALTADSFKGLTDDQKFLRVADALGRVTGSLAAAGAASQLLGKGSGELLAVFQRMTAEAYPDLVRETRALGLEVTPQMAESFLKAKESLADLKGEATGAALQFETGLIPQLTLAADAIVNLNKKLDDGKSSWERMGETSGKVLKIIIFTLAELEVYAKALGIIIYQSIGGALQEVAIVADTTLRASLQALTLNFTRVWDTIKNGGHEASASFTHALEEIKKAAADSTESIRKLSEGVTGKLPHAPQPKKRNEFEPAAPEGGDLGKERLAALKQQAEDELALDRILAQGRERADKDSYDRGLISLTEYFNRRRAAIQDAAAQEARVRGTERSALTVELKTAESKKTITPQDETAKQKEVLSIKQQITHLDAQSVEASAKLDNELVVNETERFKATEEHQLKILETEQRIAEAAGDTKRVDELKDKIEDLKTRVEELQAGLSAADIDASLGTIAAGRDVRRNRSEAQRQFEGGKTDLGERKQNLEEQVSAGTLLPYQAAQKLSQEYREQIPQLEKQVQLLRDSADAAQKLFEANGGKGASPLAVDITKDADKDQGDIDKLASEANKLDQGWMNWKNEAKADIDQISDHLTTGFNGWLAGHEKFRQAVAQTWNNIVLTAVQSIEKIAAQWIAQHLKMLLFKQATDKAGVLSTATSTAQGDTIKRASGIKEVLQAAKTTAVHAFKSVWHALPFPLNAVLAPVVAAGAFAGALALGAFAQGGAVSKGGAPRYVSFAAGGSIAAQSFLGNSHRAGGGPIRGPGTGTSDSIPILASHGEHVITAAGSSAVGPGVLDAINRDPQGMAARIHGALAVHPENGPLQPAFADGGAIMRGAFLPSIREPAPYSAEGFHRYASGGAVEVGGAGGTTNTFHLPTHIGNMSAIDGASMRSLIEEHGDLIGKIGVAAMKRHFRTNGVGG
jgi:hypothetical protein